MVQELPVLKPVNDSRAAQRASEVMEALLDLLTLAPRSKGQAILVFQEQGFIKTVFPGETAKVEQWPGEVIQGKDPQLEEAIRIVIKELEQNLPEKPVRPPFPIRVRK